MIKLNYKTEIRLTLIPGINEDQASFTKRGTETRETFCRIIHGAIDGLKYHKSWTLIIHEYKNKPEDPSTFKFYVNCDDPNSRRILIDAIRKIEIIKVDQIIEGSYLEH